MDVCYDPITLATVAPSQCGLDSTITTLPCATSACPAAVAPVWQLGSAGVCVVNASDSCDNTTLSGHAVGSTTRPLACIQVCMRGVVD